MLYEANWPHFVQDILNGMVFVGQFLFPNIGQIASHDLRDEQHKKAAFLAEFRGVSLPVCTKNTLHHRKVFLLLITERIVPLSSHSINVKAMCCVCKEAGFFSCFLNLFVIQHIGIQYPGLRIVIKFVKAVDTAYHSIIIQWQLPCLDIC